jgi:hypothetical protein
MPGPLLCLLRRAPHGERVPTVDKGNPFLPDGQVHVPYIPDGRNVVAARAGGPRR